MEEKFCLTKQSNEGEIRRYFEGVLQLSQSNKEFPVNLDDVWMLVYGQKGDAVGALKKRFEEGIDYKAVPIALASSKAKKGGQNKIDYYLSTSCLEYFIARKVRPVFEVYRKVFHKVAQKVQNTFNVPQSFSEALMLAAKQQQQIEQQQLAIEEKDATIRLQTGELQKSAPKVNYYDQTLQSKDTMTITEIGNAYGLSGKELNRHLLEANIIYKRDPQSKLYLLKKPYSAWNLAQVRTQTYTRSDGSIGTKHLLVYNERGRRFIVAFIQCNYDVRAAIKHIQGKEN